ncbi:spore germination protein [Neobacillus dielmonensis]|uniref:spore germination protein n=1 Tax=Neobacillus dielmonensis TaxID=1347369 RepID=UPI0005A90585|nr:spore germination protein [Neobacillus dielmonensis]
MAANLDGVSIGTVSGGIVNFGGAVYISPISITNSTTGSGSENSGQAVATNSGVGSTGSGISSQRINPGLQQGVASLMDVIRRSLV